MTRLDVKSTACAAVEYTAEPPVLIVEFHGKNGDAGTRWAYEPVSPFVWSEICTAHYEGKSVGSIIARIKRDPAITQSRVEEQAAA